MLMQPSVSPVIWEWMGERNGMNTTGNAAEQGAGGGGGIEHHRLRAERMGKPSTDEKHRTVGQGAGGAGT